MHIKVTTTSINELRPALNVLLLFLVVPYPAGCLCARGPQRAAVGSHQHQHLLLEPTHAPPCLDHRHPLPLFRQHNARSLAHQSLSIPTSHPRPRAKGAWIPDSIKKHTTCIALPPLLAGKVRQTRLMSEELCRRS